jgi:hypothetical protein
VRDVRPELISIHPNPTSGTFLFDVSDEVILGAQLEVFDILGKRVMWIPSMRSNLVDCSGLTSGLYIVLLKSPDYLNNKLARLTISR